ncbi:MAG TPA: hypothetical protein VGH28_02630 [Polyangiaceae bacterium]|jgi:hypothetical protein
MSPAPDKLFRAIVLGGLALVSHEACGGQTSPGDAGNDAAEEFPSELPVYVDAGVQDVSAKDAPEEFPSELPTPIDAGTD